MFIGTHLKPTSERRPFLKLIWERVTYSHMTGTKYDQKGWEEKQKEEKMKKWS